MQEVNVYTYAGTKDLNRRDRAVGYKLTVQTSKGLEERHGFEMIEDVTEKQAQILVLTMALHRLNRPCILNIYTDSEYVTSAYTLGWMKQWKKNFWMTAKGKKIANCKEWTALDLQMRKHAYRFHLNKNHEYRDFLKNGVNELMKNER